MNLKQWICKLGLEQESFCIIKKEKYPGISLNYNSNTIIWTITYDKKWEEFHLIHKLGYIWLWKKYGILDLIKKKSNHMNMDLESLYDTIMDAISYLALADMDLHFKKELLDYELKHLLHAYKGVFPDNIPIITKIGLFILCYIKYQYLFSGHIHKSLQKDFNTIIVYFLTNIQNQIIKASKNAEYPLTIEIFIKLRKILLEFESIKNTEVHRDIIDYILQICDVLPYWNREYLIEQFSHYYQ